MKLLLYGDGGQLGLFLAPSKQRRQSLTLVFRTETDAQPDIVAQLSQEVYANDVLQLLMLHIWRFEFEVRLHRPSLDDSIY